MTEFVLAVCQSFSPQVFTIGHQQIECEETGLAAVKEQIIELWLASFVETHNFTVDRSSPGMEMSFPSADQRTN
jgi:hypothetical protein